MDGMAGCHRAPVFMALSPARPLLESLSTGEPRAEQHGHGEHMVGVGSQQEWGVDRGSREVQRGRREASGSFQSRAGHCWVVTAVPKAATAETAGATRNKHANDT